MASGVLVHYLPPGFGLGNFTFCKHTVTIFHKCHSFNKNFKSYVTAPETGECPCGAGLTRLCKEKGLWPSYQTLE